MHLSYLKIRNFRNLGSAEIELPPGAAVLIGGNGSGKTSALEAIHYSLCGKSFRTSREAVMVMAGEPFLRVEARGVTAQGAGFEKSVSLGAGGQPKQSAGNRGDAPLPVVCFTPDDLALVKGPPVKRRKFLDGAVVRQQPSHRQTVIELQKALSQRNSYLQRARAGLVDLGGIAPWDRQVAALSLSVCRRRLELCRHLEDPFRRAYGAISGDSGSASMALRSQLEGLPGSGAVAELMARLRERWLADMEAGATSLGAHRDDLEFYVDGRSARTYGSQGEQRSVVLALLLAEVELVTGMGSGAPLVMLDDVMSELDPERRRRLMRRLSSRGQVIVTAADGALVSGGEMGGAALYEVENGRIARTEAR